MSQNKLKDIFSSFINKKPLFNNKKVLQANYTPENIPHRNDLIEQIGKILAPCLRNELPSNLFIYGKTGSGKTLSVKSVTNLIEKTAVEQKINIKIVYVNCKLKRVADTEYRLIAQLAREFGQSIPPTGLPTDEVYKLFFNIIDIEKQLVILVLDEIDQLVKKAGDEILYNLTRINSELKNAQINLIGISNDLVFVNNLDPRVKSSLSEEEILFPPYNAMQLQSILQERAKLAFEENIIETGVIEKCAAYAAREHGDARRALELLRVAGELAEREGETTIKIENIDQAESKIERDRILDIVKTQPKQFQIVLFSIFSISLQNMNNIQTGTVYENYKNLCPKTGLRPLTQRRVSDIIAELDMLGIINAKLINLGRYGRTKEITLATPPSTTPKLLKILRESLNF
ncbi:ORC1-type DNA replication protein [Candidatus Woesearchaeota archaeon]|mgnify:CR=1 FL=1|jgi:archaeal cell division control protein 6|nr:ORC1-type DNA replication protein [Candidatus Woesearchaeota archaeon]MBT4387338.1 ORC1-type DNA replication protein [Candidatus Woesearchaeota archaeon]MBT4595477.1 ORC1-type DNA replication protein [Candidatus Woesearchaeota archaeon]MBT5740663.1 ORC1-type DNA replication protein [Candidatus Woesearchaeota archaeon]MBT6505803.1 ORC1-type DNA replication protein [Candidatus Woesearchaeota archaeon]